jgi:hypothetical protein
LVVAPGAEQVPDRGGVPVGDAQARVHPADVEAELAGELRLETADLELDDDEARLNPPVGRVRSRKFRT